MKLIIQIPCLNEEATLAQTLADLPREIPGIDTIEYLVIDDGSTDRTADVAREQGAHHVLQLGSNRGLARAFLRGIDYALSQGADIVVNTDADNQYCGHDVPLLVAPILEGKADLVVGCRPIINHPEFGLIKKSLQLIGSHVLRQISRTHVRDAASGFRAFSRETCQRIFLHTRFSYCMETLIQAGNTGMRVSSVDVRVNPKTRDSRLFKSAWQYVTRSGGTIVAMFILYRPGRFFFYLGSAFALVALGLGLRYLLLMYGPGAEPQRGAHIASLILMAICGMTAVLLYALGVLGEISKWQRHLAEENIYLQRRQLPAHFSSKTDTVGELTDVR